MSRDTYVYIAYGLFLGLLGVFALITYLKTKKV